MTCVEQVMAGQIRLYGLPVLQRELEVILLFEFKHPISLQAASF